MDKFDLMSKQQTLKNLDRELSRVHELLLYSASCGEGTMELLAQKSKLQDHLIELSKDG